MIATLPLRRIARIAYGDALPTEVRVDGDVPVMSSGGVSGSHAEANTLAPVLVIGRKGTYGSVHWSDTPAYVIDTAYFIDQRFTQQDLRWLYYVLLTLDFASTAQDVGVPGLSRDAAYDLPCPVPPALEAQRHLAEFLDNQVQRIDEAVRLRREQVDALEQRFRALVALHVDNRNIRQVPLRRVLARIQTGSTPVVEAVFGDTGPSVGWYTPDSFGPLGRLGQPRRNYRPDSGLVVFPADSVLFVGIGWASGRVAYLTQPGAGNQQLTALTPRPDVMLGRFLLWQMFHLGQTLRRNAPFTVIPILSNDYLKAALIRLPDLEQQRRAVQAVDDAAEVLAAATSEMTAQIALLEERKRSLITAAVTGEFDVTTASGRGI